MKGELVFVFDSTQHFTSQQIQLRTHPLCSHCFDGVVELIYFPIYFLVFIPSHLFKLCVVVNTLLRVQGSKYGGQFMLIGVMVNMP